LMSRYFFQYLSNPLRFGLVDLNTNQNQVEEIARVAILFLQIVSSICFDFDSTNQDDSDTIDDSDSGTDSTANSLLELEIIKAFIASKKYPFTIFARAVIAIGQHSLCVSSTQPKLAIDDVILAKNIFLGFIQKTKAVQSSDASSSSSSNPTSLSLFSPDVQKNGALPVHNLNEWKALFSPKTDAQGNPTSPRSLIVVKHQAKWCRACAVTLPIVKNLAIVNPTVIFVSIDVDVFEDDVQTFANVEKLPTFQFYLNNDIDSVVNSFSGVKSQEAFQTLINMQIDQSKLEKVYVPQNLSGRSKISESIIHIASPRAVPVAVPQSPRLVEAGQLHHHSPVPKIKTRNQWQSLFSVGAHPTSLLFVEVGAKWCRACVRMQPVLAALMLDNPNVVFFQVDMDELMDSIEVFESVSIANVFVLFE